MSELCTANLLAELVSATITNNALLGEIITTLKAQPRGDEMIPLGEGCYDTGGDDPEILNGFVPIVEGLADMTAIVYFKEDKTLYSGATPVVVARCDCVCKPCENSLCADNPADHDVVDVGGNVIGKAWTTSIGGLSDYEVTDVGGNTLYWAMTSAICEGAIPMVDVGGNTLYWVIPS